MTQVRLQAAAAGLRQADDLLSAVDADAGRHSRHPAHLDAARTRRASRSCWATARAGASTLRYAVQPTPDGLAQAFVIGRDFVGGASSRAGAGRQHLLRPRPAADARSAPTRARPGATVFAYPVDDPERYGVVEFDAERPRAEPRGKAAAAEVALRGDRPLFLRQPGARHRRGAQALGARRARDHRRQPAPICELGELARRSHGPRHGLARHRHARVAARGGAIHRDHRAPAGTQDRLSGRDRLSPGLHRRAQRWKSSAQAMAKNGYGQYLLSLLHGPAIR